MGINNLTVAIPTHLSSTAVEAGWGTVSPIEVEAVARASEGLLPPPFWMNVVLTTTVCHGSTLTVPAASLNVNAPL